MKWYRVVKKLHLQKPAEKVLMPFCGKTEALSPVETNQILNATYPMHESSCILSRKREWPAPEYALSILVPVYNNGAYIEACLRSALEQKTDYKTEIIVVNDGSKDDTCEKLKAFEKKPDLTVIHQKNQGVSAARNKAIDLARGRYILFLDGDDMLLPGAVQLLMKNAEDHNAEVVEGGYRIVDLANNTIQEVAHKSIALDFRRDLYGFPCFKVFERSLWESLSFPPGLHYEDSIMAQILWEKLANEQKKAWGVSQPVGAYRVNPKGFSVSSQTSPCCIDTVWITRLLIKEREKAGLVPSQYYFEHLLDMAALSWVRTQLMEKEVRKAVFFAYRQFILNSMDDLHTERPERVQLEKAIRSGSFERFELICSLS